MHRLIACVAGYGLAMCAMIVAGYAGWLMSSNVLPPVSGFIGAIVFASFDALKVPLGQVVVTAWESGQRQWSLFWLAVVALVMAVAVAGEHRVLTAANDKRKADYAAELRSWEAVEKKQKAAQKALDDLGAPPESVGELRPRLDAILLDARLKGCKEALGVKALRDTCETVADYRGRIAAREGWEAAREVRDKADAELATAKKPVEPTWDLGPKSLLLIILALEVGSITGPLLDAWVARTGQTGHRRVPTNHSGQGVMDARRSDGQEADTKADSEVSTSVQKPANTAVPASRRVDRQADTGPRERLLSVLDEHGGSVQMGHRAWAGRLGVSKTRAGQIIEDARLDNLVNVRVGTTGTLVERRRPN